MEAHMRRLAATAAALGLIALALAPLEAEAQDTTPGLLTAEELRLPAPESRPLILRGSATAARRAAAAHPSAAPWEMVAGRRLWLVDPATKDVRTCTVRDTSTVGVEEIRCMSGTFGRYQRTFGPAFRP
jgi:hypothetical protein